MVISKFPGFTPLELSHRLEIDDWFSRYPPQISEFTFTNLFLWKGRGGYELSVMDGFLIIVMTPRDRKPFLLPPIGEGNISECVSKAIDALRRRENRPTIERVPTDMAIKLSDAGFPIMHDPENDDYLYLTSSIIEMPGEKFATKRGRISRLETRFETEYRSLNSELVDECLNLESSWLDLKHAESIPELAIEANAIRAGLLNFGELGYKGGVLTINGLVQGFGIGEELNSDTAVIHVAKSNWNFPGAQSLLIQKFVEHELRDYKYVNMEQDLGANNLVTLKQGFFPKKMVEKYIVGAKI